MYLTTSLSNKALLLRKTWEQEKPDFYEKIKVDNKAIQIVNALAEMIAGKMTQKEIQNLSLTINQN